MFDFDWSVLEKLPLTFAKFKYHFGIIRYDLYLNKFWFRHDYHSPQSISFEDTSELLEQINILIGEEAVFDKEFNKCYRNIITTYDTVNITPFFSDRDELHLFTTKMALNLMEKNLKLDEFRTTVATRFDLSKFHGLANI